MVIIAILLPLLGHSRCQLCTHTLTYVLKFLTAQCLSGEKNEKYNHKIMLREKALNPFPSNRPQKKSFSSCFHECMEKLNDIDMS